MFANAIPKETTPAATPTVDFANLCKNDPACRNVAVWFSTEFKVQYCNSHPVQGTKKKYVMKKSAASATSEKI